jgi:hypothetical protein
MEVQAPEKVVDGQRPPTFTVDAVEDLACGLHRQCWNIGTFAIPRDCHHTGSDTDAYGFELTQFIYHCIDLFVIWPLRVKNRLGIVEDYDHLLGGKQGPQGSHILRVFDTRADDFGETSEEMRGRGREPIATDESAVTAKPFLDSIVVEDGEGDGRFPDPACTDQSDGFEIFGDYDDLINQFPTSETGPWRRGR